MNHVGRWWPRFAAIALLLVQAPVIRLAADPSQSDFANYFTPASVLARGDEVGELYGRDAFDRALARTGIVTLGSFIPQPPANALWLLPLVGAGPSIAKALWTGVLGLALALCTVGAHRLLPGSSFWMAATLVLAPTLSIRNGLVFGQPYPILALLLLLGALAIERQRDFLGGLLLGLGASFKPYSLALGGLFVDRGRRRVLAGFAVGALAPSLLLGALGGPAPFVEFGTKVLPWMSRGEIQDPFSPGWGSAMALANRLFRFEPDLNPQPWLDAPILARLLGSGTSVGLVCLGLLSGRRAMAQGRRLDAVAIVIGFSLSASPFVASYHLVLLVVSAVALAARVQGRALVLTLLAWAVLGSSLMNAFRFATGIWTPLGYVRVFGLVAFAVGAAWPYLSWRLLRHATLLGLVAGLVSLPWGRSAEVWPRVEGGRGYSALRPHFCGVALRWWSPSADGRRMEERGGSTGCPPLDSSAKGGPRVSSRFTDGSWNLYLEAEGSSDTATRLTFSDANEIDPVIAPDGCGVIFASDQGRGLGSTALYRLDLSAFRAGCDRAERAAGPR